MTTTIKGKQKKTMPFINKIVNKKALNNLLAQVYLELGGAKTAYLANSLKNLGFRYATKGGTTISIQDLDVPEVKKQMLKSAEEEIEKATIRFLKGEITEVERYTKVIDTWSETTAKLTDEVVKNFSRTNPVYMMAFSGARGNVSQVSQLVGMRGLMADAQGKIIDLPIKSNFKEGLSVTEYIISSYGARKGLVDTALKTADSGYLTRRLVDVAQDVIIREKDCGTSNGIEMASISDGESIVVTLEERLLGRTLAKDIVDADGNVILSANQPLNREDVKKVSEYKIEKALVRSPLTCELEFGACQLCYGWSLTTNKPVDIGEAIGIIAAQSIGEPGTQLTMRTFHTGGVFKGAAAMRQINSEFEGKVTSKVATRDMRTRHGDVVQVTTKAVDLKIEDKSGKVHAIKLPYGATLFVNEGDKIKKGTIIAEFEPTMSQGDGARLTEKATKDITSDLSGEIVFDGFSVDEKRDRQGNISRTANKSGTIWVLSGDVYNLPGGSKILVDDAKEVKKGDVLAETTTISEHGGEVRIGNNIEIEQISAKGNTIKKIVSGKELTIVIASITPKNAVLETTKKETLWHVTKTGEKYIIKSPEDIIVENGMIIAELIDDRNIVTTSGEIRYDGIEVDENQIITNPGRVVFVPEEVQQINKDVNLKMVQSGTYVKSGTEIVKDIYAHIDGIVEFKEYNEVIHEIVIRPGDMHTIDTLNNLKVDDGEVVEAGQEVAKGVKAKVKSIVCILSNEADDNTLDIEDEDLEIEEETEIPDRNIDIILRPIQEFEIGPREVSIKFNSTDSQIDIVPVTQLQYRDGSRIRNVEGACLTRTSLVLTMQGYLNHLKGLVELDKDTDNLKVVVLENLIIRREIDSTSGNAGAMQTELLVEDGQHIKPKTPVSKTQVLAINEGVVKVKKKEDARRLLVISNKNKTTVPVKSKLSVKEGTLVKADQIITESGEKAPVSGQILKSTKSEVVIRNGRPCLISPATQLLVEQHGLVLRGDLLATLVFERQKTGDIVQGLPRVEELLEARKPKESAILAEDDGTVEIEYEEGAPRLFFVTENGRSEIKYTIDSSIIVSDKQKVAKGKALTSGPLNPHDIVRLNGTEAVQQYLVDEVQRVYRSQGVDIADKHIEVIVRQMTRKVKIDDAGDTQLMPGELAESYNVQVQNEQVTAEGKALAQFSPVLLGITKASLNTESFISAASFQETTRILTEVAVEGKKDQLRGLKENVIIGRLIPAGTGYYHLQNASEEKEEAMRKAARANIRKPSAILEEIEGMFGAPELQVLDDEDEI
ncbi:MAG: DNA-directed RNA polymerase subunit beta'' [Candidatus Gastranaerophilales bacterium]|nr:DNA-directed RNA polymerase subunit beta'' [Candidatus Gastranaerophilales bacterium]